MANCCDATMKIRGTKENVQKMVEIIKQNTYFYLFDEEDNNDGTITTSLGGDCRWSINSALIDTDSPNLIEMSKLYDTDVEAYSTESGCCFAEHYLIKHGETIIKDCVDYYEFDTEYSTIEEIEEELGRKVTQGELGNIEDGWLHIGGFGNIVWNI